MQPQSPDNYLQVLINRDQYQRSLSPRVGGLPFTSTVYRPTKAADDTEAVDAIAQPVLQYVLPAALAGLVGLAHGGVPGAVAGAVSPFVLPHLRGLSHNLDDVMDSLPFVPETLAAFPAMGWRSGSLRAAAGEAGGGGGAARVLPEHVQTAAWNAYDLTTGKPRPWLQKMAGAVINEAKVPIGLDDVMQNGIAAAASANPKAISDVVAHLELHNKPINPETVAEALIYRGMFRSVMDEKSYAAKVRSLDAIAEQRAGGDAEVGIADTLANLAQKSATSAELSSEEAATQQAASDAAKLELQRQLVQLTPQQATTAAKKAQFGTTSYSQLADSIGKSRSRAIQIMQDAKKELAFRNALASSSPPIVLRPRELDPSKAAFRRELLEAYGDGKVRRAMAEGGLTKDEMAAANQFFLGKGYSTSQYIERQLKIPSGTLSTAKSKVAKWLQRYGGAGLIPDPTSE